MRVTASLKRTSDPLMAELKKQIRNKYPSRSDLFYLITWYVLVNSLKIWIYFRQNGESFALIPGSYEKMTQMSIYVRWFTSYQKAVENWNSKIWKFNIWARSPRRVLVWPESLATPQGLIRQVSRMGRPCRPRGRTTFWFRFNRTEGVKRNFRSIQVDCLRTRL